MRVAVNSNEVKSILYINIDNDTVINIEMKILEYFNIDSASF